MSLPYRRRLTLCRRRSPLSLLLTDRALQLILSLYQANPPEVISKAQATLAWFQGSPQAWPMIHQLLERPDDKVKFFGALTVIIKLNKERCASRSAPMKLGC